MANRCHTINGTSTKALKPKKFNGSSWVDCPTYRFTSSSSVERMDQQLVTKTEVISGYPQWNGSWRNSSGSGTASYYRSDNIYQGKYDTYHYIGLMCFTDLFAKARAKGTITKVTLRLKNNHAYWNSGLKTRVCGASSLPSSEPTSVNFSWGGTTAFSSDISFGKNASTPITITLNSTAISQIQNNQVNGFRLLAPGGFALTDYGYFDGSTNSSIRPYCEITVQYQVWE